MQNTKLLLICTRHGRNPCTKFGIDQVKGSKNIERTTQWAEKCGLTLTFEHVTRKSIGIIYSLRATPALSLVSIKWRGQKILSGQHLVSRPTDRPTDSCKTYCPLFQGGGGDKTYCPLFQGGGDKNGDVVRCGAPNHKKYFLLVPLIYCLKFS